MSETIDKEVQAIGVVLKALEPLSDEARSSVLDYVARRLQIDLPPLGASAIEPPDRQGTTSKVPVDTQPPPADLRELVEAKKPHSAIEMATLVAYYLSSAAPEKERKVTVTTKDIEAYFKIGGFRLPSKPQFTLPNTKSAGYLEALGEGQYRLNPVGYNLVVHSMPTRSQRPQAKRKKQARNKTDAPIKK